MLPGGVGRAPRQEDPGGRRSRSEDYASGGGGVRAICARRGRSTRPGAPSLTPRIGRSYPAAKSFSRGKAAVTVAWIRRPGPLHMTGMMRVVGPLR